MIHPLRSALVRLHLQFAWFGVLQHKEDIDTLQQVQWSAAKTVRGESRTRRHGDLGSVLRRAG